MARSLAAHIPGSLSREKEATPPHKSSKDSVRELGKDKQFCKTDPGHSVQRRERERGREEPRPHSVVDLTLDVKAEDERRTGSSERPTKTAEHMWPFFQQCSPTSDTKPKHPLQPSSLSNCRSSSSGTPTRYQNTEQERIEWDDENTRPPIDKQKRCDSVASSLGALHVSYASPSSLQSSPAQHLPPRLASSGTYPPPHHMPPSLYQLYSAAKEPPAKEHRVTAPTYVPSVEVYNERKGPIQIASQARDNKNDKGRERTPLQVGGEKMSADLGRSSVRCESPSSHGDIKRDIVREEGSVIRANSLVIKRPSPSDLCTSKSGLSPDSRDLTNNTSKHLIKTGLEAEARSQEREIIQRSGSTHTSLDPTALHSTEAKWKPFELGNYATSHMAALAAQHAHGPRREEEGKRMYLDPVAAARPAGSRCSPDSHSEVSAMQSLIKYSGNFSSEASSRQASDSRSAFGGLGSLKLESSQHAGSKAQHLPPQQLGKQLKREPERPESAKSFGRDGNSSLGEAEVRHPPVGIAVAVARQRDNNSKPSSASDRDRPILSGGIKGKILSFKLN